MVCPCGLACAAILCLQAGWSLDPCRSCGVNVPTDTTDSDGLGVSVDQCYLPPGWGSVDKTGRLVASRCNNGSYGASERTYGVEAYPCQVRDMVQLLWVHAACLTSWLVTQRQTAVPSG